MTLDSLRLRRAAAVLLLAAGGVAGVVPTPAASASTSAPTSAAAASTVRPSRARHHVPALPHNRALAPGARVTFRDFRYPKRVKQRSALLHLDLGNRHLRLDTTTPGGVLAARRRTVAALTRSARAIAAVNTAFFDLRDDHSAPRDGVISSGHVLQTPRSHWDANLVVSRSGRARVGAIEFSGTVALISGGRAVSHKPLRGVNNMRTLTVANRVQLLTPALQKPRFPSRCTVVVTAAGPHGRVVTSVRARVRSSPTMRRGQLGLVACGSGTRVTWLAHLRVHQRVSVRWAIAGGTPWALASGGNLLVLHGRAHHDPDGEVIHAKGSTRSPETFACVQRDHRHLILGVVDGRLSWAVGMTYRELQHYLLTLRCDSAVVFDGGGSTTLTGRTSTRAAVATLNHPCYGARTVPAALVLRRH